VRAPRQHHCSFVLRGPRHGQAHLLPNLPKRTLYQCRTRTAAAPSGSAARIRHVAAWGRSPRAGLANHRAATRLTWCGAGVVRAEWSRTPVGLRSSTWARSTAHGVYCSSDSVRSRRSQTPLPAVLLLPSAFPRGTEERAAAAAEGREGGSSRPSPLPRL
jgi:hypothetical protein